MIITKQILDNEAAKLELALNLLSDNDVDTFEKQCQELPYEDTYWVYEDLQEFMDDNEVEYDNINDLSAKDLIDKLREGMEYDGLIGYFDTYYKVFKALFAKHPELLIEGDSYDYQEDEEDK